MKRKKICWLLLSFAGVMFVCQIFIQVIYSEDLKESEFGPHKYGISKKEIEFMDVTDPIILWWTPFTGDMGTVRECGSNRCFFTQDRKFFKHPLTKVLMFYGSQFDKYDLPLPRNRSNLIWSLLHEESPKNIPMLSHPEALSLFNYTATFSRYSSFPLTLQYLKDLDILTGVDYFIPTEMKNTLLSELAPVVYVHSDCTTPLERDAYVTELMKYIPIDSYGACIQNKKLPKHLSDPIESMNNEEFFHIMSRYKFTLAFENAVCEDYITEKLWRTLIVGSVPVYMGSPSVKDWLPNNNSVILASDFKSPQELASFLQDVNQDQKKYESYLLHKLAKVDQRIGNDRLLSAMAKREWGIDNDFEKGNMVNHFECFVCTKIHQEKILESIADISHYDCPIPISPLTQQVNRSNWWVDLWYSGKCEAQIIKNYMDKNLPAFTKEEFQKELRASLSNGVCQHHHL